MAASFNGIDFDESAYLEVNPDAAEAVVRGHFVSGEHHYRIFGAAEGRALKSRRNSAHGRIAIAGTGRAGTTLLVQILTRLGFDTGFSLEQSVTAVDAISHAGLEHDLGPDSPVVVKSPWLAHRSKHCASIRAYGVQFMLVPIRSLAQAAESRRRVTRENQRRGVVDGEHPGGLWLTREPADQERILAEQFYDTLYLAARSDIDPSLIEFPRFAVSDGHLWERAGALWRTYGVSREELASALADVVDKTLVGAE